MNAARLVLLVLDVPVLLIVGFLAYLGWGSVGVPAAAACIVLSAVLTFVLYGLALTRRLFPPVVVVLAIVLGLSVALSPRVAMSKTGADRSAVAILFVPPVLLSAALSTIAGALGARARSVRERRGT